MYYVRKIEYKWHKLTKEEAAGLLVEARFNFSNELDVYAKSCTQSNFITRIFTLKDLPANMKKWDEDQLLEYARNNMPESFDIS